ncbi:MAG: type 2 isopentenyl-diphosphate Delta-isomerase [Deltaproteobacteria bacterium]|nr:MAG: type 2 isopentenyl-diphosphate Delta-isomerase [Deltaproteobacteria bacterium]
MTKDPTNRRKIEHLRIVAEDPGVERSGGYFDAIRLEHRALPELDLARIDPHVVFLGKRLSFPLLISSMTGGDHEELRRINRNLALAAQTTGIGMAVGSQRVIFTTPAARSAFTLRQYAPDTLLCANLGAVQLNYGFTERACREAVDLVGADALYLHLNPLQEAIQPEGNTNFAGLAEKIGQVAASLPVPLIVKEVGCGISARDVALLLSHGIRYIDVAGTGGTSWSRIEHHRSPDREMSIGLTFQDWGIPTPEALRLLRPFRDRVTLVASGGLRSGIDIAKAIILGASLCAMAAPFLEPAMESPQAVVRHIERIKREFVTTMFLLGVSNVATLFGNESLLRP